LVGVCHSLNVTNYIVFLGFGGRGPVPAVWVVVDIGIGIISLIEFFTRSGFRWDSGAYLRSHFFDFVAIVPGAAPCQTRDRY